MKQRGRFIIAALSFVLLAAHVAFAAYNHLGDTDSVNFRSVYPDKVGTKLDSCTTCHSGGSYVSGGKTTTLGSCQWCHYVTNYGADLSDATLSQTLNSYGLAYKNNGRSANALLAINDIEVVLSERKCCQGCRAKISFEKNPGLIGVFLDFWCRTGNFPESESWLEAVPRKPFNLWAK